MKIAVVESFIEEFGGREAFTYEVVKRLIKHHDIHIFCNSIHPQNKMLQDGFPITTISSRRSFCGKFVAYFGIRALKKVIEKAKKWHPEIIWLNTGYIFADYIKIHYGVPVIPFVHFPETFQPYKRSFMRDLYRKALRIEQFEKVSYSKVKVVLCNSHYTGNKVRQLQPNANIRVVYPGLDHNVFRPTWEDDNYLYYHSRFQESKNQVLALDIAKDTGCRLILSGHVTKYHELYYRKVKEKAERIGVKIISTPSYEEVIRLLQRCSIFLFPSINEHFGIAPVEAMACGKPVIGHRSGGTIETVGEVGILCGDHVKEWSGIISYLMENSDVRKDMGEKSWEFSKRFTWENTVGQILDVLKSY